MEVTSAVGSDKAMVVNIVPQVNSAGGGEHKVGGLGSPEIEVTPITEGKKDVICLPRHHRPLLAQK